MRVHACWCLLLFAVAAFLSSCDPAEPSGVPQGNDIPGLLASDGNFQSLTEVLPLTSLSATLNESGPFTLFAPTDYAFEFLGDETVNLLRSPNNRDLLEQVLRFHVVPGLVSFEDLVDGLELQTLDGTVLTIEIREEELRIGGALIEGETIEADNGLIHGITDVLRSNLGTADRVKLTPILSRFAMLAEDTGAITSMEASAQVTVFAPINNAFPLVGTPEFNAYISSFNADVLERIMDFHIAEGLHPIESMEVGSKITTIDGVEVTVTLQDGVRGLDGRRIISEPVKTANGLIYLLNGVLNDSLTIEQRLRLEPTASAYAEMVGDSGDLRAQLSGPGEFTVFAPRSAAFDSLGQQVLDVLNSSSAASLKEGITRAHVVSGLYEADDLTNGLVLESIDGTSLPIVVLPSAVFVSSRELISVDIPAQNGVIHLINDIIYPEGVGILSSILQRRFLQQFVAVHRSGLMPLFTKPDLVTMFAFPDSVYARETKPMLIDRSDLSSIILYNAAEGEIGPLEHGLVFQSLEGTNRTIALDPLTNRYRLDGIGAITTYPLSPNGQLYAVDEFTIPPEFRVGN